MGDFFIRGQGGEFYELPVLNASYPQDVSIMESASGSATFAVKIATHGKPAEYKYQWYVNGSAVSGATASSYTKTGLTTAATYTVHCEVTNKAGIVTSRVATLAVTSSKPAYTYGGNSEIIQDGTYNWRIKFKTSGTLRFTSLGSMAGGIDVFCVGGGGGGAQTGSGGAGGKTSKNSFTPQVNVDYSVIVGGGGSGGSSSPNNLGGKGGQSKFHTYSADGGGGATGSGGGTGGSGGGGAAYSGETAGAGGYDGGNGARGGGGDSQVGGSGQGGTTREFGETSGTLYAGGGGGGGRYGSGGAGGSGGGGSGNTWGAGGNGSTNYGGGGGGGGNGSNGGSGGSGIVVIRNKR